MILLVMLTACGGHRLSRNQHDDAAKQLERDLTGLIAGPSPKAQDEAQQLATIVIDTIDQQGRRYRMLPMPWVNNGLVDIGLKRRGLCHHWAEDLVTALAAVKPQSYEVHWMVARKGTLREHNAVMIKARDPAPPVSSAGSGANGGRTQIQSVRVASFEAAPGPGIIIDPWRTAGHPFWIQMERDQYPWRDDPESLAETLP